MTMALQGVAVYLMEVHMPNSKPTTRRDTLNLRIKPDDRGLIERAAPRE
jgi:hypothetical protein